MSSTHFIPDMKVTAAQLRAVETDVVVVPVFEDDDLSDLTDLSTATISETDRARVSGEFKGKLYDCFCTPVASAWRAKRVLLAGCGPREKFSNERLRRLATASGLSARQRRAERIAFLHRGAADSDAIQAIAEGLTLANFDNGFYKAGGFAGVWIRTAEIVAPGQDAAGFGAVAQRGCILGGCSNMARSLANEPGNILTPTVFAERATTLAGEAGVAVEVFEERQIAALKMGLLLGVARGSSEPPRLIVMRHEPPGATGPVLGLVGKGITFDSGGISIKPSDGMERMKDDMSGGAAVICAMRAIAVLGAPIRVVGVVPATENMPGGRATKPGDVLTSASGKTVEVINTDAEGRLILGDALWYAQQIGATHLVDIATLTGSCVVALGKHASGLFGAPERWVEHVRQMANRAGDRVWPMPVSEEYTEQLKSEIADMTNTGGRPAGAITAAMFLKEFTGNLPWVHLDIAGTAWAEEALPYQPKGATGVGVRTLAQLAFTSGKW